jgi:hypothetical protein
MHYFNIDTYICLNKLDVILQKFQNTVETIAAFWIDTCEVWYIAVHP